MTENENNDGWYKEWFGQDYLIVYPHRNEEEARFQANFVENVLPLSIGDRILDLGCGNGRHALQLTSRGHFVAGFDLSNVLLTEAKQNSKRQFCARFVQGDMRHLPFAQAFDAVVSFFTTFGYFESDKENLRTFQNIHGALKTGGKFMQDYMNKTYLLNQLIPYDEKQVNGITITQERSYVERTKRIEKKITLHEGAKKREYFESVRLYSFDEIINLLHQANLNLSASYGDFDGQEFTEESPRLILLGKKAI